jgi:hypothetical protein
VKSKPVVERMIEAVRNGPGKGGPFGKHEQKDVDALRDLSRVTPDNPVVSKDGGFTRER